MKSNSKTYALIAMLVLVQACGLKNEENSEATSETTSLKTDELAKIQQRRATIKKDSALIAEKRLKAWNDMVTKAPTYVDPKGTVIYYKSQTNPTFSGGNSAMMKYLRENIVYPTQAEKDELEGTVFVDFVIGLDGSVSDAEVTNATSTDVDQAFKDEAIRLVTSMPKWVPGLQNDEAVNVKYSIPISFQIR